MEDYQRPIGFDGRVAREVIHMASAVMWSHRSVCNRASVGCVITTYDLRSVLGVGYNGPGHSLAHECPTPLGQVCGCLHAEDNAIASIQSVPAAMSLFTTMAPCLMCSQRIINRRIARVYYLDPYRDTSGLDALRDANVELFKMERAGWLKSLARRPTS